MKKIYLIFVCIILSSCSKKIEETAAYQAACHGAPISKQALGQAINQAQEEGYGINRQFNCIDKTSYLAMKEEEARILAANTPEAKAKREAEFAEREKHFAEQRAHDREEEARKTAEINQEIETMSNTALRNVDVNTATEEEIANVITIGPEVAAEIIKERNKRPFNDWADLISREVVGFSAAQTVLFASICGLSVNGKSLDGVPPNPRMAALLYQKYKQYQK